MENNEFQKKLKELCLKHDIKNGESYDPSYAGCAIYDSFCEETGLESDYLGELYKLEEGEQTEEKPTEYYISEDEIKLGDLVCDGHSPSPIGFVSGIMYEGTVVDGSPGCAFESGRILIRSSLKKLCIRRKTD